MPESTELTRVEMGMKANSMKSSSYQELARPEVVAITLISEDRIWNSRGAKESIAKEAKLEIRWTTRKMEPLFIQRT